MFVSVNWLRLLSALIIVVSSTTVVMAKPNQSVSSDCWRVLATCALKVSLRAEAKTAYNATTTLSPIVVTRRISYVVAFWGELEDSTDTQQFITQAAETLADQRGWVRAGLDFRRVDSGGDFTLILSQAEILDTIPGCDHNWSCRSGRNVIINEDRWRSASAAWSEAGGNLRDYRHMVVNHETGHWLGHGHYSCTDGTDNLAPLMQQQSISLQGCQFNPWPLQFEIGGV